MNQDDSQDDDHVLVDPDLEAQSAQEHQQHDEQMSYEDLYNDN